MNKPVELTEKTKQLLFTALNDMMISVWDGHAFTYADYSILDNAERTKIYDQFRKTLDELGLKMREDVYTRH